MTSDTTASNVTKSSEGRGRFRKATLGALAAAGAAVLLIACNSSKGTPTSPTPTAPPAPRLITQGGFPLQAPTDDGIFFAVVPVTDASLGRWEATVDWANASNTLWMWVADGVCTVEQFAMPACPFEAACPCRFTIRSETAVPKPRVMSIPNAAGGTRTLIVANMGPGEEAVEYRVTLTAGGLATGRTESVADGNDRTGVPASSGRKARLQRQ